MNSYILWAMNFIKKFKIEPERRFRLKDVDPGDNGGYDKDEASVILAKNSDLMFKYQNMLYAENRRALLIILQGMDAAGKDGVIGHVMRGLNPQGCTVTPFKAPSKEELNHDFLWRIHKVVPEKGDIGIFNRSQYEDVLIARVENLVPEKQWKRRYKEINHFEHMLVENGVTILKFFLYISRDEQRDRLRERLKDPAKNWKFNPTDLIERKRWQDYMEAYEDALNRCSTDWAPWFIVPADKKWFRNLVVSEIIVGTLADMRLKLPKPLADLTKIKIH